MDHEERAFTHDHFVPSQGDKACRAQRHAVHMGHNHAVEPLQRVIDRHAVPHAATRGIEAHMQRLDVQGVQLLDKILGLDPKKPDLVINQDFRFFVRLFDDNLGFFPVKRTFLQCHRLGFLGLVRPACQD